MSRRTFVPFLPRIISTTLSRRMSRTSWNSAAPCATAVILIAHLEPTVALRWSAGNKALDLGVTIFRPQHRADANEREAHVDAEILQVGFAQVFGVRIVGLRQRSEKKFHLLVAIFFMHVAHETIVAARDQLRTRLDRMIAQFFLEQLVRDPRLPDLIGFGFILRPVAIFAGSIQSCRRL